MIEKDNKGYGEGHRTVHLNPYLWRVLPDVHRAIYEVSNMAALKAEWEPLLDKHPSVEGRPRLGMRVVEHLSYSKAGGLGWHDDGGSIYTLSIMLNDPVAYEGGGLILQRDMDTDADEDPIKGWCHFCSSFLFFISCAYSLLMNSNTLSLTLTSSSDLSSSFVPSVQP